MVSTHAHAIWPATPQRTARRPRTAPTPMIGARDDLGGGHRMPRPVEVKMVMAPAVSAAKPPIGTSSGDPAAIVWMMRHPPERVPSAIAACAMSTIHIGMRQRSAGISHQVFGTAARIECAGDDAHGLLRVVAPVAQAVHRRRDQLASPEDGIDAARRPLAEQPEEHDHEHRAQHKSNRRAITMNDSVLTSRSR